MKLSPFDETLQNKKVKNKIVVVFKKKAYCYTQLKFLSNYQLNFNKYSNLAIKNKEQERVFLCDAYGKKKHEKIGLFQYATDDSLFIFWQKCAPVVHFSPKLIFFLAIHPFLIDCIALFLMDHANMLILNVWFFH